MKYSKLPIFSWTLYDFANTTFSSIIVSIYFALWVTETHQTEDLYYSLALSISTLIVAVLVPLLGAISDRYNRRIPYLRGYTLGCVFFTMLMSTANNVFVGLVFFSLAYSCFQISLIFYDSLLPRITTQNRVGRVSGYGVGVGYIGALVGLFLVRPFADHGGYQATFIPTALLYLIFSIPCLIFIKEDSKRPARITPHDLVQAWKKVRETFRKTRQFSNFFYFLLASFFILNAVNTIIFFMTVYIKKVVGFTQGEINAFFAFSVTAAIFGAFACGFATDRFGPLRTLKAVLTLWLVSGSIAIFAQTQNHIWIIGPLIGIAMGSTWVTSRALLLQLAPQHKVAEFFGLLGLAGRFSSIIGPLIWGMTIWLFSPLGTIRYRIALAILISILAVGRLILERVKIPKTSSAS